MDRIAYYRRWKLGEDPHALAKEAGVARERMRHMLAKMDAEVPLVDRLTAAEARVKELEAVIKSLSRLDTQADLDAAKREARVEGMRAALDEIAYSPDVEWARGAVEDLIEAERGK